MADRKRKLEVDDSPAAKKQEVLPQDDPTGGINPYTGRPYSLKYYEILSKRKGVPPGLLLVLGPQGLACLLLQHGQLRAVPRTCAAAAAAALSPPVAEAAAACDAIPLHGTHTPCLGSARFKPAAMHLWESSAASYTQVCLCGRPRTNL